MNTSGSQQLASQLSTIKQWEVSLWETHVQSLICIQQLSCGVNSRGYMMVIYLNDYRCYLQMLADMGITKKSYTYQQWCRDAIRYNAL